MTGLFIDGFAGGGGASTGIAQAIGREVDIAINHSETAIAIHKANHPGTDHHCQDIRALWPRVATGGRQVDGAWFSPDCKEFSKAKGGPVKDRSIRALCWEVVWWVQETQPAVAYLENVEEFEYAAPLDGNGVPMPDRKGREFKRFVGKIRRAGYRVDWKLLKACDYGTPTSRRRLYMVMRRDKQRIVWPKPTHAPANDDRVLRGELLPYRTAAECIDWTIDCPSIFDRKKDLVDSTNRRIAHGIMRYVVNAARPFIVPVTHTKGWSRSHDSLDPLRTVTTANGGELAAVDLTVAPHVTKYHGTGVGSPIGNPMPTVTANGQPARDAGAIPLGLVGATLVRTGHGEADKSGKRRGKGFHDLRESAPTSTASRDEALATAELVEVPFIDRQFSGSTPRPATDPIGASTAGGGGKSAKVSAFLSRYYGTNRGTNGDIVAPIPTISTGGGKGGGHSAIVAAHIEQANTGMVGHSPRRPLSTIVGKGSTQRIVETTMIEADALPPAMMERAVQVAAFLVKYYATDGENETSQIQAATRPLDAITTKARFAVVTVTIDAVTYVIVDIGLRMLKPRELARAQGFPDSYVLDPECWYVTDKGTRKFGRLPIAKQISAIGNSVCPPVARALVAANQPRNVEMALAA